MSLLLRWRALSLGAPTKRNCQRRLRSTVALQSTPSGPDSAEDPLALPQGGVSYVAGRTDTPLLSKTLGRFWASIVEKNADALALVSRHERPADRPADCLRWTFADMDGQSDRLARGLLAMGIRKGDRIGVLSPNNSSYATLQWASAKIGAILATMNPAYKMPEVLSALRIVGCKALFIAPDLRGKPVISELCAAVPSLASARPHELFDPSVPDLRSVVLIDNLTNGDAPNLFSSTLSLVRGIVGYNEILVRGRGIIDEVKRAGEMLDDQDIISLQFTSGTTGLPKAVSLSHQSLLNNGYYIGSRMNLSPKDRVCNVPPLFHCFGLVLGNLAAWTHGASVFYPSETFDPVRTIRTVVEEKCTALHGVATMFISQLAIIERVDRGEVVPGLGGLELDFSTLRTGIAAGSPVPHHIMRKIMDRLNLQEQTIAYGMTETSPVTFMTHTGDPLPKRIHSVGRILPHVRAKIVDPASIDDPDPAPLPIGTPGELLVSGYPLQKGYWNNRTETDKVMKTDRDGRLWMWTGDLCTLDDEGYLAVVGRSKDVIIRGGENLFPTRIENVILTLDGVADASVVSVPDDFFGEAVGVFVRRGGGPLGASVTPAAIRLHVDRHVSHQNAPAWVWFLGEDGVAEEYPLTASGKIRKVDLREWAKELSAKGVGKATNK